MAQLTVSAREITKNKDICEGVPILAGTRVRVSDIAGVYDFQGMTPEQIAEEFSLSVADVFSALTYYYEHLEDIRQEIQSRKAFFEKVRTEP